MLKMIADTKQGKMLMLGLSAENVRRLQELHQPIDIDTHELGETHFDRIVIWSGTTEEAMKAELTSLIPSAATVTSRPSKRGA